MTFVCVRACMLYVSVHLLLDLFIFCCSLKRCSMNHYNITHLTKASNFQFQTSHSFFTCTHVLIGKTISTSAFFGAWREKLKLHFTR